MKLVMRSAYSTVAEVNDGSEIEIRQNVMGETVSIYLNPVQARQLAAWLMEHLLDDADEFTDEDDE